MTQAASSLVGVTAPRNAPELDDRQRAALDRIAALGRSGATLRCAAARGRLAAFLRLAEAAAHGRPRLDDTGAAGDAGGWR